MINERGREILEMIKRREISSKEGMKLIAQLKQEEEIKVSSASGGNQGPAGAHEACNCEIAVIGMAAKLPDANDIHELWNNLVEGKNSIRVADRWELEDFYDPNPNAIGKSVSKWGGFISGIDKFDPLFFNMSPKEAELMDPQQRLFLMEAWRALEDAGYSDKELDNRKCGVFVGFNASDYIKAIEKNNVPLDGFMLTGNNESVISGRVSYFLNLKGPGITVNTACSSSLVAIHLACESIRSGTCEMAVAGGVMIMVTSNIHALLSSTGMLSPVGQCKTFDNKADGFVPGEGAGAVVLKRLDKALADGDHVYAVIAGSGINQDGKTNGIAAPSSPSQTELELEVYERYGINPENIGYIETHGTGTRLGDPIEVDALTAAFGKYTKKKQFCALGSIKTNMGHALAAAGVSGFIKTVLTVSRKKLVPSLNLEKENEMINFKDSPFYVNTVVRDWMVPEGCSRIAAVSSFGFSGTNAHIVIREFEADNKGAEVNTTPKWMIFPFSAKSPNSLKQRLLDFCNWLDNNESRCRPSDVSYTLLCGRSHFQHTSVFVARDMNELGMAIRSVLNEGQAENYVTGELRDIRLKIDPVMMKNGESCIRELAQSSEAGESIREKLIFLAGLYTKGYTLDWKKLFNNEGCKRISMPAYPFDDESYWFSEGEAGGVKKISKSLPKLHPLVDENISGFKGQRFKKKLTAGEFIVSDHQVEGRMVFPGAAYIEMACAAGAIAGERRVNSVKNVVWAKPIALHGMEEDVYISLYPIGEDAEYEVSTRDEKGSEVVHSQGRLSFEESIENEFIDIEAVSARCFNRKESSDCYSLFNKIGMNYGPAFRSIQWICNNKNEALALLEIPKEQKKDFKEYILHPSIIDGALQAAMGLAQNLPGIQDSPYLPFGIGKINIYDVLPEKCYVYVTPAGNGQNDANLLKYNVKMVRPDGKVILSMCDFSVRLLQGKVHSECAEKLYMEKVWLESPLMQDKGPNFNEPVILFDTNEYMYKLLAAKAPDGGKGSIMLVKPGQGFKSSNGIFEINPLDADHYTKLVDSLQSSATLTRRAIFMWGREAFSRDEGALDKQQMGMLSVFYFIKALMKSNQKEKLRIQFVHMAENSSANPFYEALGSFARSLRLENPVYALKTVQLDMSETELNSELVGVLRLIMNEFEAEDFEVRYQSGTRFVNTLVHQPLTIKEEKKPLLRKNGTYLITGGMGGVGYIFATYLAKEYKAKLVLTGRSSLNSAIEQSIRQLEEYGSEVLYVPSDISKKDEVAKLFAAAKKHFKGINGIIHSAGLIRDSILINKSVESFMEVIGPKIYGTMWLDEASGKENLDFYAIFSAGASVIGNAGQCDYAYANGFIDSYAGKRILEGRRGKTMVINWPYWENGGMMLPDEGIEAMKRAGMMPLKSEAGIDIFVEGLGSDSKQVIAFYGDPIRIMNALESRSRAAQGEIEASAMPEGKGKVKLLEDTEVYLKEVMSKVIKLPAARIDSREPLEKYGIDSVMIIGLNRELEVCFGELPKTLFFEYQTVRELAEYFVQEHHEALLEKISGTKKGEAQGEQLDLEEYEELISIKDRQLNDVAEAGTVDKEAPVSDDIAIIGVHGRYPMGGNVEAFWNNLVEGRDCISEIPLERWDHSKYYDHDKDKGKVYSKWGGFIENVDKFDPLFFHITPRDAEIADPQERIFLESVYHAIEDAGYTKTKLSSSRVGVYVGVMYGQYQMYGAEETMKGNMMALSSSYSSIANRVSYFFNFNGPSIALDTMCSSSLTAVHLACESLKNNEIDVAVAGGVNLSLHPAKYIMLSQGKFAASDGRCRSFGDGGDGYVPGEGVGSLILKHLSKAKKDGDRIYAVIKATAVNHGGKTNGYTVPNPNAQTDVISEALKKARINPRTISYIEAHGTGTSLGDPIEITGLTKAFGKYTSDKQFCSIGSVKSNIGHTESAAGVASITKVVLQMKHKKLVPSIHSGKLNPNINFNNTPFYVQKSIAPWDQPVVEENGREIRYPRRAGISSFGAGGSNAHVIIEEYENNDNTYIEDPGEKNVFLLSAKNKERLIAYANEMLNYLSSQEELNGVADTNAHIEELLVKDMVKAAAVLLNIDKSEIDINENIFDFGFDRVLLNSFITGLVSTFELDALFSIPDDYNSIGGMTKQLISQFSDRIARHYAKENSLLNSGSGLIRLCDIAYTLQSGRDAMEERMAAVVSSIPEIRKALKAFIDGTPAGSMYTGRQGSDADSIFADLEKEKEIEKLLKVRNLDRLAKAWASGTDINWMKLYPAGRPNVVSLPNYPFSRRRIWFGSFKGSTPVRQTLGKEIEHKKVDIKIPSALVTPVSMEKPANIGINDDISKSSNRIEWEKVEDYQSSEVTLEIINGNIAVVTMQDRVRKNILSEEVIRGLMAKFAWIAKNVEIKAVIVTGYDNVFCMGGAQEQLISIAERKRRFTDVPFLFRGFLDTEIPVISAIQGHASGGGLLFGLYADIVIMAEESVYSAVFTKYGFTPGMGATYVLKEKFGINIANEMMYTAKPFSGSELKERGAPVIVRKRQEVLKEALSMARALAEKPRNTLKILKQELAGRFLGQLLISIDHESYMHELTFTQPEVKKRIDYYYPDAMRASQKAAAAAADKPDALSVHPEEPVKVQAVKTVVFDREAIQQELLEILSGILYMPAEEIDKDMSFKDMGVDSISGVEIVRDINKKYNLNLDAVVLYDYSTVTAITGHITDEIGASRGEWAPAGEKDFKDNVEDGEILNMLERFKDYDLSEDEIEKFLEGLNI